MIRWEEGGGLALLLCLDTNRCTQTIEWAEGDVVIAAISRAAFEVVAIASIRIEAMHHAPLRRQGHFECSKKNSKRKNSSSSNVIVMRTFLRLSVCVSIWKLVACGECLRGRLRSHPGRKRRLQPGRRAVRATAAAGMMIEIVKARCLQLLVLMQRTRRRAALARWVISKAN